MQRALSSSGPRGSRADRGQRKAEPGVREIPIGRGPPFECASLKSQLRSHRVCKRIHAVKSKTPTALPIPRVESLIFQVGGERVIVDSDLASIYAVTTRRLNEQVRRNFDRFPEDFVFRLTREELTRLKSQNATSSSRHGGRRKLPFVFTEHGAIMAATVLNSSRAVQMSVYVVRAFVQLRRSLAGHKELAQKLQVLERKVESHDVEIHSVIEAIRKLMSLPEKAKRQIGFVVKEKGAKYRARRG